MVRSSSADADADWHQYHAQPVALKRSRAASRQAKDAGWTTKRDRVPASRVDLSRLKVLSLRKYMKLYDLENVSSSSSKEELAAAVARHWNNTVVSEEQVLIGVATTLKKMSEAGR